MHPTTPASAVLEDPKKPADQPPNHSLSPALASARGFGTPARPVQARDLRLFGEATTVWSYGLFGEEEYSAGRDAAGGVGLWWLEPFLSCHALATARCSSKRFASLKRQHEHTGAGVGHFRHSTKRPWDTFGLQRQIRDPVMESLRLITWQGCPLVKSNH